MQTTLQVNCCRRHESREPKVILGGKVGGVRFRLTGGWPEGVDPVAARGFSGHERLTVGDGRP